VLCEKPLGMNHAQAMAITEACADANVVFMEAFMYRCHPQTRRVVEVIRSGEIGQVQVVDASFGFRAGHNPKSRLLDKALGGGGILDVGCYVISMARLVAGAANNRDFAEPKSLKGVGHLGETGADEWAAAVLEFEGGVIGRVACGVRCNMDNVVRIFGTDGHITIPSPWFCSPTGDSIKISVHSNGQSRDEVIETDRSLYAYEADAFAHAVGGGQVLAPAMGAADSIGNARALDLWRAQIGLNYEQDTPQGNSAPLRGKYLRLLNARR
jgi:predicted dehydrogenase